MDNIKVLIPFRYDNPKVRLSLYLKKEEREQLAISMLSDVLNAIKNAGIEDVTVLLQSITPNNEITEKIEAKVELDNSDLNNAINRRIDKNTAVIVSDLPLINERILKKFFETEGDVVISPGRRGGTNMLFVRKKFKVNYHYGSYLKHITIAKNMDYRVSIFDSFFAGCDIDTPDDLIEVLIHAPNSKTGKFLKKLGFRLVLEKNPKLIRVMEV